MAELQSGGPAPWERQVGEGPKAFAAFCVYRDMGTERSLSKVAAQLNKTFPWMGALSSRYGWVRRAAAWDDEQERIKRATHIKELEGMQRRHTLLGQLIQSKGAKRFQMMTDEEVQLMSTWEALRTVETGVKLERGGRGEPPDGPMPVQPSQVNITANMPIMQLLRNSPEKIGPVIEALAVLRDALPQLAAGAMNGTNGQVKDLPDDLDEEEEEVRE